MRKLTASIATIALLTTGVALAAPASAAEATLGGSINKDGATVTGKIDTKDGDKKGDEGSSFDQLTGSSKDKKDADKDGDKDADKDGDLSSQVKGLFGDKDKKDEDTKDKKDADKDGDLSSQVKGLFGDKDKKDEDSKDKKDDLSSSFGSSEDKKDGDKKADSDKGEKKDEDNTTTIVAVVAALIALLGLGAVFTGAVQIPGFAVPAIPGLPAAK